MLADLIAQGHSMISRLERLTGLSYEQLKAIPDEQQVSWQETQEWKTEATRRVHEVFGDRADARLELQYKLWQEDVESGKGDEVSRVLTYHRRVVSILQELQEIVSA